MQNAKVFVTNVLWWYNENITADMLMFFCVSGRLSVGRNITEVILLIVM